MELSNVIILILAILLYLAVGFVVALMHYLSPGNQKMTPLKAVFLAPFAGVIWLVKRF